MIEKLCSACQTTKPIDQFHKRARSSDGYDFKCRECKNEYQRAYTQQSHVKVKKQRWQSVYYSKPENKQKRQQWTTEYLARPEIKERQKWQAIKQKYKLTKEEVEAKLNLVGHRCIICNAHITKDTAVVDHDHVTGKLRGLLCRSCNIGLGCFHDNVGDLESAIVYLKEAVW